MSYNGSGTFQINTSGQPVVAGTVISSTAFNALTADLATGLSTAITKDGQTTTTARIPFAAGINSSLATDSSSTSTGSIITAGGVGVAKALYVGTTANIAGVLSTTSPNITTSITTPSTSFDLINATATTLNLGGAATTFNVGAATGTMTVANTTLAAKAITASTTLSVTGVTTVQAGTAALPAITTTGDTNTGIFFPAADTIAFAEGGAEAMRITSAGNVGIGSLTTYEAKLKIATTNGASDFSSSGINICGATEITSGQVLPISFTPIGNDSNRARAAIGCIVGTNWGFGNLGFYTRGVADASLLTTADEKMRITSDGNVGIGTTNPSRSKLVIGATTPQISFTDTDGSSNIIDITRVAGPGLSFSSNGSEKMRIDSSGNVGIGTNAPAYKLEVRSSMAVLDGSANIGFYANGTSYTQIWQTFQSPNDLILKTTAAKYIAFLPNNTEAMRVDSGGALILVGSTAQKATGTTWSNPSDQRLKSNIQDYAKGTAELMQVRVREWEYNGKGGTTDGMKGLGVIADEVMTVLPNTVETYDAKLNANDEETTAIKKFDATEITWLLVKTVQEQQALITALTARITALEAK